MFYVNEGERQNMEHIEEIIKASKKVVIKIGSNVLSTSEGTVDDRVIKDITQQIQSLIDDDKQVIIVSSGAGVYGVGAINKWSRKNDVNYKQALCAIGQVELMMAWKECFSVYDRHVAQMLLTRGDFDDSHRTLNIRNAMFTLIDEGVIPVINENDSVSVDEIKIGDNDTLGALVSILWNADLMIILSDIDGVYNKDPKTNADAELINCVNNADELFSKIDVKGKSSFGTGGISTKIHAASRVNGYGIPMLLLNGQKERIITDCSEGKGKGTLFIDDSNK